jgi:hypothetical protein
MKRYGQYLIPSIVIIVFVFILAVPIYKMAESWSVEYELVSISNSSSISGSFFLGTGSIGQKAVFYFYIKNTDGSIKLMNSFADVTTIKETDNPPRATLFKKAWKDREWEIAIPRGSMINTFELDPRKIK